MKWKYIESKYWYLWIIPKLHHKWVEYNGSSKLYKTYYCYRWLWWSIDRLAEVHEIE